MDIKLKYKAWIGEKHADIAHTLMGNDIEIFAIEFAEHLLKNCSIPVVSKGLGVNSKVCLKKHKNITGTVVDSSNVGFNHWMVKWDRTGETIREYGNDLVVNVFPNMMLNVCPICGNKRCPHATDHNYECTKSNDVGQTGSLYGGNGR